MNKEEFIALIEAQGTAAANWPQNLRSEIELLLAQDSSAADALAEYRELETLMLRMPVPDFTAATARIALSDLPPQPLSKLEAMLNWLFPYSGSGLVWRPALLACLPLLFGVAMGNYYNFGVSSDPLLQDWDDELAMISLNDYSENLVEL